MSLLDPRFQRCDETGMRVTYTPEFATPEEYQAWLVDRWREEWASTEARYAYVESFLHSKIACQIFNIRKKRGLTQQQLAEVIGTKQSGVARMEDVNFWNWKVGTLQKIARAFGLRLRISFEEFSTYPAEFFGLMESCEAQPYEQDSVFGDKPSASEERSQ